MNEWLRSISGSDTDWHNRNTGSKSCPTATLSTCSATCTGPLVYVTTEHPTVAEINDDFNIQVSLKDNSRT